MNRTVLLLLAFAFLAPRVACADDPPEPRIELHWNTCGNQQIEPYTPTDHVLLVILAGAEGDYDGIEVTIGVDGRCNWPLVSEIPDAWRFDNAGCQAGLLQITRPASDNGCPGLVASQTFDSVTLGTQQECFYGYPCGEMTALLIRITSVFPLRHLSRTTNYVVAKITIPMQETVANIDPNGVLCGCASTPLKIEPIQAMLSPIANQYATFGGYRTAWVQDNYCVAAPQPTPGLNAQPCLVVPAQAQSWGAVKASYR